METALELGEKAVGTPTETLLVILSIMVVGLAAYAIHAVFSMARNKDKSDG